MNETLYIEGATTLESRLLRITQIIEALELRAVESVANEDVEEYSIDDGQVKIKTSYRGLENISKAIQAYEIIKQRILNKLNGRSMVLRPWRGLY